MSDYEPVHPVPPREQLAEAYQLLVRAKNLMERASERWPKQQKRPPVKELERVIAMVKRQRS